MSIDVCKRKTVTKLLNSTLWFYVVLFMKYIKYIYTYTAICICNIYRCIIACISMYIERQTHTYFYHEILKVACYNHVVLRRITVLWKELQVYNCFKTWALEMNKAWMTNQWSNSKCQFCSRKTCVFLYLIILFFSIIAGLQCSVNFLLYSMVTQLHIHV